MEAVMMAARSAVRPDDTASLEQVIAEAARGGVHESIAVRAIENWTALDVWKPSADLLAIGGWARGASADEIRQMARGEGRPRGAGKPEMVLLSLFDGSGMARVGTDDLLRRLRIPDALKAS
eukprot:4412416-Lingulodinium_polyedra.AAC.1